MFVSSIIPTVDRSTLARSVNSVLEQKLRGDDFEVIVVNDSGRPLVAAPWQLSERVHIIETQRRDRCFARNTGASMATGRYIHFLDDDDWLLPGALEAFHAVADTSDAGWIYGTTLFLDEKEQLMAEHHVGVRGNSFVQIVGGEWIPLQGSIIRNDVFFSAGGFDWRYIMVEDKDLCRRVAFTWDLAYTKAKVACLLRDRQNTTTDYRTTMKRNTWSRDEILSRKAAFTRMRESVPNAYWAGKVVRSYLTCVSCNLSKGNLLTAHSRALRVLAGFAIAGTNMIRKDFWRAILNQHSRPGIF